MRIIKADKKIHQIVSFGRHGSYPINPILAVSITTTVRHSLSITEPDQETQYLYQIMSTTPQRRNRKK